MSTVRITLYISFLPVLMLLCGFFWTTPNWENINSTLDRKYASVTHINTDDLRTLVQRGNQTILIDVREADEYAVSHLPGAVNILSPVEVNYPTDTSIVLYCSVGIRSAKFARDLENRGFTRVMNLRGSIFEWANKGYRLMRGDKDVQEVHPFNKRWSKLLKPSLHRYYPPTP
ncbi:MAG: rhodanese-like domain-containing protein [Desulforhopalus sp.]